MALPPDGPWPAEILRDGVPEAIVAIVDGDHLDLPTSLDGGRLRVAFTRSREGGPG